MQSITVVSIFVSYYIRVEIYLQDRTLERLSLVHQKFERRSEDHDR